MRSVGRALLAVLATTATVRADGELTEEERCAFAWFDGLGYPDLANAPFVRIYTGACHQVGDAPWTALPEYGFLLADDGKSFQAFTVGLETLCMTRTGPEKPAHERIGYERIPLDDYVESGLQHLAELPEGEDPWASEPFGHGEYQPPSWFRLLVFARACAREGRPDLVHGLWKLVESDWSFRRWERGSVRETMQRQVAEEALRFLILDFSDPERSWADLLARSRWWRDKFAEIAKPEWVREMIPRLERIVANPEEPGEPVAKLVFRLRDATDATERGDVPAGAGADLVRMGPEAVPKLLDAWDDLTPSRSVRRKFGTRGHVRPMLSVVPVGAHVRAIVEEIAGREFASPVEVRLWYAGVRRDGEKAVLVRAVSEGGMHAARSADLLQDRYPDAAEEAILAGIGNTGDPDVRSQLVSDLRPIRTERVTRFLLDEIRVADAAQRSYAAWLLLDRDRTEGAAAVIDLWRRGETAGALWSFLARCGRTKAVVALGDRFAALPVGTRIEIAGAFIMKRGWCFTPPAPESELPAPDATWKVAVETLLMRALEDENRKRHLSIMWNDYSFTDPRVCDVAACALREMFPDRYPFDWRAPVAHRDRQLAEFRSRWRADHPR